MTTTCTTPVAELLQRPAFAGAAKRMASVREALQVGFSTEAARKDGMSALGSAFRGVRDVLNHVTLAFLEREDQEEYARHWDNSFPMDLHLVRDKHYTYAASFRDDLEPLFAVMRELVALRAELKAYTLAPTKTPKRDRVAKEGEAFKLVGHCPCCSRVQAVVQGEHMSKHGYKVDKQWSFFKGVCSGERYPAIETSRVQADRIVDQMLANAADSLAYARRLRAGKAKPHSACKWDGKAGKYIEVPFAELSEREQGNEVISATFAAESEARQYASFAKHMKELIERVHGQPLRRMPV